MYTRIPENLEEPLLKELRRMRLVSSIKYFPVVVLIFSALATLVVLTKGHAILEILREELPPNISDRTIVIFGLSGIVVVTAVACLFIMRSLYKDCRCQKCLYCAKCDAVDNFDSGSCPVCARPLTDQASFLFTTDKDELRILKRAGLFPSRDA